MERIRIAVSLAIAITVTVVWAGVVITAFAIHPGNAQLVTLATVITPVLGLVVGGLLAEPVVRKWRNGR